MLSLTSPAAGALAALSSALAWTIITLMVRSLAPHFSAFSLNIVRAGVGGAFLVVAAVALSDLGSLRHVSGGAWVFIVISVVTAVGIGDTAFFESTKTIGLATALTVSTSYPLLASILAVWLFGEQVTPLDGAGAIVTVAGLVVIVTERKPVPTGPEDSPGAGSRPSPAAGATEDAAVQRQRGLALCLLSAVAWAVSATLMKAPLREIDPLPIQAVRLPLTALLLWLTPWARGTVRTLWRQRGSLGLTILALGALTALSSVAFTAGLKYAGITLGTVLSSTAPLFALPIGLVAFGERVTLRAATGAILCVTGISLLSL